jgi:glucose/arabinose dehydrogenase
VRLAALIAMLVCAAVPAAAHAQAGYEIPPDNPFVNTPGAAPEVYALGLRNPFRFSFDRATGDLLIGDVGGGLREEIDWIGRTAARGANFGWPCREGKVDGPPPPDDPRCPTPAPQYVEPLFDYLTSEPGPDAVTGGFVVRDPALSGLVGRALYADFFTGTIFSLALNPSAPDNQSTGETVPQLASFGEDAAGRLYVASLTGDVRRLTPGASAGTLSSVPVTGPWQEPIALATVPGDPSRLLVAERAGRVRLAVNGAAQPGAIAEVPGVSSGGERGLLSVVAAPDFVFSGRMFVYYTDLGGDIRVDELSRCGQRNLMSIEHSSAGNHNGGTLQFGPDGHLWISTGDGGNQDDFFNNAQNRATLLGKLLRIDPGPGCAQTAVAGPPPPGPVAADTTGPALRTRVKRRQRVLRLRGVVAYVRCSEACSIAAGGRLRIRGRRYRLRPAAAAAQVGQRRRIKVLLTRRGRRALRRAVRRGRRPIVRVNLRARDATGNASPLLTRRVRVRR